MLKMDQVVKCKQLRARGMGIRAIARELEISRNTVRDYLRGDREPGVYVQKSRREQPVRDELRPKVEALLKEEQERATPRKQRLTAARVHRILGSQGDRASASLVRKLVGEVRLEIRDPLQHAYLPLDYEPGDEIQHSCRMNA